jgi:sporulation protein YlmC with PRC-barrel domain
MRHRSMALSASSLIGDNVKNPHGEDLGKIEEIMIDTDNGRVAYAVLSFGGFLGIGDKLFAIPWDALRVAPEEKAFVINIDRETLENAPGFDKDNWPQTPSGDDDWLASVYDYYDTPPYWETTV